METVWNVLFEKVDQLVIRYKDYILFQTLKNKNGLPTEEYYKHSFSAEVRRAGNYYKLFIWSNGVCLHCIIKK